MKLTQHGTKINCIIKMQKLKEHLAYIYNNNAIRMMKLFKFIPNPFDFK